MKLKTLLFSLSALAFFAACNSNATIENASMQTPTTTSIEAENIVENNTPQQQEKPPIIPHKPQGKAMAYSEIETYFHEPAYYEEPLYFDPHPQGEWIPRTDKSVWGKDHRMLPVNYVNNYNLNSHNLLEAMTYYTSCNNGYQGYKTSGYYSKKPEIVFSCSEAGGYEIYKTLTAKGYEQNTYMEHKTYCGFKYHNNVLYFIENTVYEDGREEERVYITETYLDNFYQQVLNGAYTLRKLNSNQTYKLNFKGGRLSGHSLYNYYYIYSINKAGNLTDDIVLVLRDIENYERDRTPKEEFFILKYDANAKAFILHDILNQHWCEGINTMSYETGLLCFEENNEIVQIGNPLYVLQYGH